ncbi:MAG: Flp pilus assembly protein CpaB [Phycisphaerales bacterium]|jgi:pilus assembly protein CpaB|nr:Flp pilus assembly protein CpaB [Phycisphaerales bacterium]MDB5358621.1 Flp pilus assembly protein CpaB [Phycisphaerales bacterium]
MKWKTWVPVVAAIVLGGMAAKIAKNQLSKSNAATPTKSVQVVVAKVNVPPGQELTAEQLTMTTLAATSAPPEAFTATGDVVGRVLTMPLLTGQTVLQSSLAPKGTIAGLPSLVPPGMRAITIDVNEANGIAGMLQPGCRVDIISTLHQQKNGALITRTVVQNAMVQAVGQLLATAAKTDDGKPAPMFRTVTMVVTAREAEIIELANSSGRFRIALRGSGDKEDSDPRGVTEVDLLGNPEISDPVPPQQVVDHQPPTQPAVEVAEMPKRTVELIEGTKSTKVVFEVPQQPIDAGNGDLQGPAVPNVGDERPER